MPLSPVYAQINFGINAGFFNGILLFILGIAYGISAITVLLRRASRMSTLSIFLYLGQGVIAILLLPFCGFILVFQGWRLEPIMQFGQFLLAVFITFVCVKDILINLVDKGRW